MDQALVATGFQRQIPDEGSYPQMIRAQHEADDGNNKPVVSTSSGEAGTKMKQDRIDIF